MHPLIANNSGFQSVFSCNLSYIFNKVSEFFIQKICHCLWYEKNVYVLFLYFFFQMIFECGRQLTVLQIENVFRVWANWKRIRSILRRACLTVSYPSPCFYPFSGYINFSQKWRYIFWLIINSEMNLALSVYLCVRMSVYCKPNHCLSFNTILVKFGIHTSYCCTL